MGKLKREFKKKRREAIKRLIPSPMQTGRLHERFGGPPLLTDAQLQNQPLIGSTPILYSDLVDYDPAEYELGELIEVFEKRPTFFMLCMLNTLLSFYTKDISNAARVQKRLAASLLDQNSLSELNKSLRAIL